MNKRYFLLGIMIVGSMSYAMQIVMPDAHTLEQRLFKRRLEHFVKETQIIPNLANQTLDILNIATIISHSLQEYQQILEKPGKSALVSAMIETMKLNEPRVYEAVLEGQSEALAELQQHGFYKPVRRRSNTSPHIESEIC